MEPAYLNTTETTQLIIKVEDPGAAPTETQNLHELGEIQMDINFEDGSPYERQSNTLVTNRYTIDWFNALDVENVRDVTGRTLKDGVSYTFSFGAVSGIAQGTRLLLYEGGERAFTRYTATEVGNEVASDVVVPGQVGVEHHQDDIGEVITSGEHGFEYEFHYINTGYMIIREN